MKTRIFISVVIALSLISASGYAAGPNELLISEVLVTPTEGEYIEIFNPNAFAVDLSNVYITDATYAPGGSFYFKIVTGDADDAGGAGGYYDFHARFPDGASIGAGEYQTVAIAGSAGFFSVFGEMPTYELFEEEGTADAIPDMREALPGSIDFANAGLTNSSEPVILYYWDGSSDLVVDLDYLIWGSSTTTIADKAIDKTGVTIDGPDAGSTPSAYLNDTAVSSQQHIVDSNGHTFGMSWTRIDESEGTETATGGNGVSGEDETSENMNVTFAERTPSPNTGFLGTVGVSILDASITEGDSSTQQMNFTISLTEAAPAGGVSVQVDTADGTATSGSDYIAISGLVANISAGSSDTTVAVTINGDSIGEGNETFTVTLSNPVGTGVVLWVDQGEGVIKNDDEVTIGVIQSPDEFSSLADDVVTTRDNVVTAVGVDGFFMQSTPGSSDGDCATSDGIFVLTESVPTVSLGDLVDVTGTIEEFYGFTQIVNSPSVTITGTAALPAPTVLDATFPSNLAEPSACLTWESHESMLVSASGLVVGPTQSFGTDPVAEFVVIATSGPQPFREIGAEYPGLADLPPTVPIFDGNPEIFEIDPDKLGYPNISASAGDTYVATGALGYEYDDWEIWASSTVIVTAGPDVLDPVRPAVSGEMTVGSLNLYRFFNDYDDPGDADDDYVLDPVSYDARLSKTGRFITQVLQSPDVIAVQEVENVYVLRDIAWEIWYADPTVVYDSYLVEGDDFGGMNIGFMVRDTVANVVTTQLGADETIVPEGYTLHDRPPLLLEGTWIGPSGSESFDFALLGVHGRSLGGVDNPTNSFARRKRLQQAVSTADMVQTYQTSAPTIPFLVVGDFNAFEFTDGYIDVIGQICGTVDPTQNYMSAPTVTSPLLVDAISLLPAGERFSYIYGGSAQVFDHVLIGASAMPYMSGFEFGRGNSQVEETLLFDTSTPKGTSDHDGLVFYMKPSGTLIFSDGFESGGLTIWSDSQP